MSDYYSSLENVEDCNKYREGGYHPVKLGECYSSTDATYKIIHKLGHGSYSTVWLGSVLDDKQQPLK